MPKILALDTSTDACSVALDINGNVTQDFRIIPRQHTKQLLPMVQDMLREHDLTVADLDAIAVGRGPGSFAGIRIATGAAHRAWPSRRNCRCCQPPRWRRWR